MQKCYWINFKRRLSGCHAFHMLFNGRGKRGWVKQQGVVMNVEACTVSGGAAGFRNIFCRRVDCLATSGEGNARHKSRTRILPAANCHLMYRTLAHERGLPNLWDSLLKPFVTLSKIFVHLEPCRFDALF